MMSMPKSVTRIRKDGVVFIDNVDKTKYMIHELSRAALRDCVKFIKKEFRELYYSTFNKITGAAGKSIKANVYSNKNTIYPRVELGIPQASRGNEVEGFYSMFQEIGSSKQRKLGLLKKSVENNFQQCVDRE